MSHESEELSARLRAIFSTICTPSHRRGELLVEELKKNETEIDESKCLSLIKKGVDLHYGVIFSGNTKLDKELTHLASSITGKADAEPSNPEAFILACGKGKVDIVRAMINAKIINPAQWSSTRETGMMAAAKTGRLDVVECVDSAIWQLERDRERFDITDNQGKRAYDHAKENCHLDIMKYMLEQSFLDYTTYLDPRTTDPPGVQAAYQDEMKRYEQRVAKELQEAVQLAADKKASPHSKTHQNIPAGLGR